MLGQVMPRRPASPTDESLPPDSRLNRGTLTGMLSMLRKDTHLRLMRLVANAFFLAAALLPLRSAVAAEGFAVATYPPNLVLAATRSSNTNSYYTADEGVPTRLLDPAARDVIRNSSRWPGPYSEAREALLALGWQPDPKANCLGSLVGNDVSQHWCDDKPNDEGCRACRVTPELHSCSEGPVMYCLYDLVNPQSKSLLQIVTTGDAYDSRDVESFTFFDLSSPER